MASMLRRIGGWLYQQPYLLVCIACMTWALNVVLGRYVVVGHFPPVALSFLRWGVAFLIFLPFAWPYLQRDWPVIRKHMLILTVLAITGTSAYNTMAYWGLQYTQAINALLIQSTAPLIIAFFTFAMWGERLTPHQVVGILISSLGVIVILCRGDLEVIRSVSFNRGDIWFFSALLVFAFYSALMKKRPAMNPISFLAFSMGCGTFWLIPVFAWEISTGRTAPMDMMSFLTVIWVAIFPSIIAMICYNRGIELAGANRVGALFPLIVAFGAVFAIVLLGERPQLFHVVGCALVLGGAFIATRKGRVAKAEAA